MRLRHKKPLNPYKGQTNNDKNEFNDDDFKQQGSPHKKAANGSTDQIYKYARILSKFIKTINQEYNAYQLQHEHYVPPQPTSNPNQPSNHHQENTTLGLAFLNYEQIKQQKQITKIQIKTQQKDEFRDTRPPSKKKDFNPPIQPPKQNKIKPLENSFSNGFNSTKNTISSKTPSQVINKIEKETIHQKVNYPNKNTINLPTHLDPNTNPNTNFNFPNIKTDDGLTSPIGITGAANGNIQNYLNLSALINPNQLMNLQMFRGLSQMPIGQLPLGYPPIDRMIQGYMPMNIAMMNMGLNSPQIMMNQQFQPKPFQNLFNQQVKVYNSKTNLQEAKNIKEVYPLKRSAFHVAIAYKIYLDKLKRQGNSFQKLEDIDPTKNARRVKNTQNQSSKPKQGQKKKK